MTRSQAFKILNIEESATEEEIKKAFKKLAVQWHPDKNPDNKKESEENFKSILEAKETLLKPQAPQAVESPFYESEHSENAFAEMFTRAFREQAFSRRGEDIHHVLAITLEESIKGCDKSFWIDRLRKCNTCKGAGGTGEKACEYCDGRGRNQTQQNGFVTFAQICIICKGRGSQVMKKCNDCQGQGRIPKKSSVRIELKPGTTDGFTMMKHHFGHEGTDGAQPGNFYLHVAVEEHDLFTRIDDDLYMEWPLSFGIAALGGSIEIPTLISGNVKLHIPAGTQPDSVFRLHGKGVGKGSQIVKVKVTIPKNLNEKQKKLLKEFVQEGS